MLSLSVDLYVGGVENEATMTRSRLLADDRVVSMATVAMTMVALTTALTELDGKTRYYCLRVMYYFYRCFRVSSRIKLGHR